MQATLRNLTESESLALYDFLLDATDYLPLLAVFYWGSGKYAGQKRYKLTVPGMSQSSLRDLLRQLRDPHTHCFSLP